MITITLWPIWALGTLVLSLTSIVYYWRIAISLPASIPTVGIRNEVFSKTRAWIRELTVGLATLREGYFTHNTKGKSFALLDTSGRPHIVVPKELLRWLVGQPETVLSHREVLDNKFAVKYFIPPIRNALDKGMVLAIRRDLTRNLGKTQREMFELIRERIDTIMGLDESWHEVSLIGVLGPAMSSVNHRMLVGEELCRNEKFMTSMRNFSNMIGLASILIGQYVPYFMAPLAGYASYLLIFVFWKRALQYLIPAFQERLNLIQRDKTDPNFSYQPSLDIMQWIIGTCPDSTATEIANALLGLALGAVHTSINTSATALLDILSSPPELGYYEAIHEEAAGVFRNKEDWDNSDSINKLTRIDSAIRESMRLNPPLGRIAMHEVLSKNGVTLPNGPHIPRGAWLGIAATGIHLDERFYPGAHTYDAFRFSRGRAEIAQMEENETTESTKAVSEKQSDFGKSVEGKPNGALLSTSQEEFLAFGFGRHSCPGRWFAAHIMKMGLAYIALNYEIQQIKERPVYLILGDCVIPPRNVNLRVRRRKSGSVSQDSVFKMDIAEGA